MNRDFEKEYRKYSADDTPDLWDRIEAGIDGAGTEQKEKTVRIGEQRNREFRKYSGWVAAAVCALLVIPAVLRSGTFKTAAPQEAAPADQMAAAAETYAALTAEEAAKGKNAPAAEYKPPVAEYAEKEAAAPLEECAPANAVTAAALSAEQATDSAGITAEPEDRVYLRADFAEENDAQRERPAVDAAGLDSGYASVILLTPEETLYDIGILRISVDGITENGELTVREAELLYEAESAEPEIPLAVRIAFTGDTFPEYAVSFKDAGGEPHQMALWISGKDGSVLLTPVRIKK